MADLSALGGGGVSEISFRQAGVIPVGSGPGGILTITPPAGQRVIITGLACDSQTQSQFGISIVGSIVGNVSVGGITGGDLLEGFYIGQISEWATATGSTSTFNVNRKIRTNTIQQMAFKLDEIVTINSSGATTVPLRYSYAYGS